MSNKDIIPFEERVKPFRDFIWLKIHVSSEDKSHLDLIPMELFKSVPVEKGSRRLYITNEGWQYSNCVLGVMMGHYFPTPEVVSNYYPLISEVEAKFITDHFDEAVWGRKEFMDFFEVGVDSDGNYIDLAKEWE
jgi:hypothetical protein